MKRVQRGTKPKNDVDALGHSLWDSYVSSDEKVHYLERDDGYLDDESDHSYFSATHEWSTLTKRALKMARGRVLDLGCGAGRHAMYLQRRGVDVTGIDVSPLAIRVCQKKGMRKAMVMSIHDLRFKPHSFDAVVMLWNNFGLFGSAGQFQKDLRKLSAITTSSGRIIAEFLDPYQTDDVDHLRYGRWNRSRGRMTGQVRLRVRYRNFRSRWFDYLFVSRREMQQLLRKTEWRVKQFIGQGPQYLAIIEKKA